MIRKEHLENFLRLNGIPRTAPEEVVRSVFRTAGWPEEDIDMTISVLQGKEPIDTPKDVAARQLFHSEYRVSPELLSALIGFEICLNQHDVATEPGRKQNNLRRTIWFMSLGALSAVVVTGIVVAALYLALGFQSAS